MNPENAEHFFLATFTASERQFLLAHPEFKAALAHSTEGVADVKKLNKLGVKLLLQGGYQPPPLPERPRPKA